MNRLSECAISFPMSYYTLFLLPSIALCSRGLRELGWPSRALPAACRRTCRASRTLVPPNYRVALAEFSHSRGSGRCPKRRLASGVFSVFQGFGDGSASAGLLCSEQTPPQRTPPTARSPIGKPRCSRGRGAPPVERPATARTSQWCAGSRLRADRELANWLL